MVDRGGRVTSRLTVRGPLYAATCGTTDQESSSSSHGVASSLISGPPSRAAGADADIGALSGALGSAGRPIRLRIDRPCRPKSTAARHGTGSGASWSIGPAHAL